ncbi:MAG: LUD domain-containing protein [Alphaproteobacteria bacterium]|nr:LUD domain-containing protein [Alphaproteobacteria bacterium]
MSDARSRILARIAAARGAPLPAANAIAAERAALLPDASATQPTFTEQDTLARFEAMATSERLTATVAHLDRMEVVPGAVAAYLADKGLPAEAAVAPVLADLDWGGVRAATAIAPNQAVAVTLAEGGVAETGSLVFRSGAETPMLHNFLGLHHIAVVRKDGIGRYLESVFGADAPALPRILTLVTGTSGTADIEAVNIRGAHGPRYLHILVLDSDPQTGERAKPAASEPVIFDDDDAYHKWLRQHPDGWVLNVRARGGPDHAVLHRATCPTLARSGASTAAGHRKVCCSSPEEVAAAARAEGRPDGTPSKCCSVCSASLAPE